jgi:hypothetical protein
VWAAIKGALPWRKRSAENVRSSRISKRFADTREDRMDATPDAALVCPNIGICMNLQKNMRLGAASIGSDTQKGLRQHRNDIGINMGRNNAGSTKYGETQIRTKSLIHGLGVPMGLLRRTTTKC